MSMTGSSVITAHSQQYRLSKNAVLAAQQISANFIKEFQGLCRCCNCCLKTEKKHSD